MMSDAVSTASLKSSYGRTRLGIEQRFMDRKNPEVALTELAQAVDDLVTQVAEPFQRQSDFSLIALGGYGRREMYPHSDVDLLILFREAKREVVESSVTRMLQQLWDLGLDLGHQVWSIDQLEGALEPIEFGLALLDARLLVNGRGPGQTLLDSLLPGLLSQNRSKLEETIISFAEERHRNFRGTIYQLEPDLKQAPGGLRDYLTGKWLLQLGGTRPFLTQSQAEIEEAASFMRRARIWLHFSSGRNQNRLRHPLQEALALALYGSKSGDRPDVETLMKEYFLNARILNSFLRQADGNPKTGAISFRDCSLRDCVPGQCGGRTADLPAIHSGVASFERRHPQCDCPISSRLSCKLTLPSAEESATRPVPASSGTLSKPYRDVRVRCCQSPRYIPHPVTKVIPPFWETSSSRLSLVLLVLVGKTFPNQFPPWKFESPSGPSTSVVLAAGLATD